jgi:IS4 transposase
VRAAGGVEQNRRFRPDQAGKQVSGADRAGAVFVIRDKTNTKFRRRYSHPVDRSQGLICDQTIRLTGQHTRKTYPDTLRRIKLRDPKTRKALVLLTNNRELPAVTIAELYRCRWQIELFFKWIKQHLRIKAFYSTSQNAVRTQIWIAISVYVLVAIIRKRLGLTASLYTILQVLSLTTFEKTPLDQLLGETGRTEPMNQNPNQLNLFT